MSRVIIICEGQTEQSFCNDLLQDHFSYKEIYIENPTIKKTHGGIVNWAALKHQIESHLKEDKNALVTTLIDYYGIHEHHKYPEWKEAQTLNNKNAAITRIEAGMLSSISASLQNRFIPYIQLHEFEGLLFSDISVFDNSFEEDEFLDYGYLVKTIHDYPNPEMINDGPNTAPSKRLSKIIKGYYSDNENYKVLYGSLLAQDLGLKTIREKCPRFNDWINKLENI